MKNIFNLIFYYTLLFTGLLMTSWIIWARFIRERTIRDIPDNLLTEFRFWILCYICCIYLYAVKSLIKPAQGSLITKKLSEILYKPLNTLDQTLKYNKYIKNYYNEKMLKLATIIDPFDGLYKHFSWTLFIFFMEILPRIILIIFLLLDVFYFHKLEIFYKIVLIGLLPFIYKYIKYSLKDICEQWIIILENNYTSVQIYEEGYKDDEEHKKYTEAIYHYEKKTIREYIDIKLENTLNNINSNVTYEYNASPYATREAYNNYNIKKYKTTIMQMNLEDIQHLKALFFKLIPKIFMLKFIIMILSYIEDTQMKIAKIIIFASYLICWLYILIISYYYYPIELIMGKYFFINYMSYLISIDNPFSELFWGSLNENLITIDNIKILIQQLIKKLWEKFLE